MLRNDLRQDLPASDVLKMFPMPGWQVVLGEVMAPAAILVGVQWLLLLVALFLVPNHFDSYSIPAGRPGRRRAGGGGCPALRGFDCHAHSKCGGLIFPGLVSIGQGSAARF